MAMRTRCRIRVILFVQPFGHSPTSHSPTTSPLTPTGIRLCPSLRSCSPLAYQPDIPSTILPHPITRTHIQCRRRRRHSTVRSRTCRMLHAQRNPMRRRVHQCIQRDACVIPLLMWRRKGGYGMRGCCRHGHGVIRTRWMGGTCGGPRVENWSWGLGKRVE